MVPIRQTNLRREEVDTVDEVQKLFNDVYRALRALQAEIADVRSDVKSDIAAAVKAMKKETSKKETKE